MKHYSLIQKNKAKKNFIWSIREFDTDTKQIKFISTKTKNKKDALDFLALYQKETIANPKGARIELKQAVQLWLNSISGTTADRTQYQYTYYINKILNFADNKSIFINDINQAELNEYYNKLTQDKTTSEKRYIHLIWSMFFKWAIDIYQLNIKNPINAIKQPKKEKKEKEFWTLEELDKIIKSTQDKQSRLSFAFMAYAGLRINETLSLKWEQVTDKIIIKGKGGKTCILPISKKLKEEIDLYTQTEEKGKDKIFTYKALTIRTILKDVCRKTNLDNGIITPHKFRHSFASNLLRKGANIIAVSKLMRHESPTITLNIYSHIITADLNETLDLLN